MNNYYFKEDTIEENDFESILNIYNEVFQTENVEDQIEENRDSFVREFFNRFQLFGLSSAFKKFQTKEDLLQHEERAVIVFTNKFTTCTLNEKEIASRTDDEILKIRATDGKFVSNGPVRQSLWDLEIAGSHWLTNAILCNKPCGTTGPTMFVATSLVGPANETQRYDKVCRDKACGTF